jgi:hypothetical protein
MGSSYYHAKSGTARKVNSLPDTQFLFPYGTECSAEHNQIIKVHSNNDSCFRHPYPNLEIVIRPGGTMLVQIC